MEPLARMRTHHRPPRLWVTHQSANVPSLENTVSDVVAAPTYRARVLVALGVVAMLLLLTTGAGFAAKTVSPKAWAAKYCNAMTPTVASLEATQPLLDAFGDSATPSGTTAAAAVKYFSNIKSSLRKSVKEIEKAGSPKVANGTRISALMIKSMKKTATNFADLEKRARALDTTASSEATNTAVTALLDKMDAAAKPMIDTETAMKKLDPKNTLDKIISSIPACKAIE